MSVKSTNSNYCNKAKNPCNQFIIEKFAQLKLTADIRKMQNQSHCYKKIIKSLTKYPLPIISMQQALMLQGVGKKMGYLIKNLIHEQYKEYLNEKGQTQQFHEAIQNQSQIQEIDMTSKVSLEVKSDTEIQEFREEDFYYSKQRVPSQTIFTKKQISEDCLSVKSREYKPKENSAPYYVLQILQMENQYLSKKQLKNKVSQIFSFDINSWTFLKTLESHLMIKSELNRQIKYSIQVEGRKYLQKIRIKNKPMSKNYVQIMKKLSQNSQQDVKQVQQTRTQAIIFTKEDLKSYKIILMIDSREIKDQKDRQYFYQKLLTKYNIQCKVTHLPIGDFLWILETQKGSFILDYIIQRKIADDLAISIIDGRYKQQKYRLKQSGIKNIFYIFEGNPSTNCALPQQSINTALLNTQIIQKFKIIKTKDINQSIKYLAFITNQIKTEIQRSDSIQIVSEYDIFKQRIQKSAISMNKIFGLMLNCIPNIGKQSVKILTGKFMTIKDFYTTLEKLQKEQRGMLIKTLIKQKSKYSESIAQTIIQLFFKKIA